MAVTGFPLGGRRKLTPARRAIASKVNYLSPPRTHTVGHQPTVATGSFLAPFLIAFGQRADQKVLIFQGAMPRWPDFTPDSTY